KSKNDYKTYNYTGEVIKDTKAASNIKGEAFEYYSRPVNADRTDSISLVKDEVQILAVCDQNLSKYYSNPDENNNLKLVKAQNYNDNRNLED
ncbi:22462_t:CDS:1, partial [Racocetra persica]